MAFIRALYIGKCIRRWSLCTCKVFSQDCSGAWAVSLPTSLRSALPQFLPSLSSLLREWNRYVNFTYTTFFPSFIVQNHVGIASSTILPWMLHTPTYTLWCEGSSLTTRASLTASMLLRRLCHTLNPGFFLLTFAILTNASHERIVSETVPNTKRHCTSPRARRRWATLSSTSQMPILMLTVRSPFF